MAKKPLAERLQGVEGHPVVIIVKWAVGAWLLVWSVLAPVQSCRQQAEADRRAGLLSVPDVRLELHADRCTLLNTGVRPVAEVTLIWTNYAVLTNPCRMWTGTKASPEPAAAARELPPRGTIEAIRLAEENQGERPHLLSSFPREGNAMFVECEARYHRQADLESYSKRELGLVDPATGSIRPLATLVSVDGGKLRWHDERNRDAHACLTAGIQDILRSPVGRTDWAKDQAKINEAKERERNRLLGKPSG